MAGKLETDEAFLADVRRERARLVEQIRSSEEIISRSKVLLARIDEMLAKQDLKRSILTHQRPDPSAGGD